VVVDDASTDATGAVAQQAGGGDARLILLRNDRNLGPSAGRNRAIAATRAPLIAILDADDYLLPGRFAGLLALPDWDMVADNIAFVPEGLAERPLVGLPEVARDPLRLDLAAFARGNLRRGGRADRGELGFLKPVLSRAFLDRHALRFDEGLWLGEDFDLYVRMLSAGARFVVSHRCGYVALVREGSLSGRHRTRDLAALLAACARNLGAQGIAPEARAALRQHLAEVKGKWLLRQFLDLKKEAGMVSAMTFALMPPARLLPIFSGILGDKLRPLRGAPAELPALRLLLPTQG
jgi:succinoglycan biosynthesis protein ExoU